jgi:DNA-binding PadR family transcriptional regulator
MGGDGGMTRKALVLVSLEFMEPCSVKKLWDVLRQNATLARMKRHTVYRYLYGLESEGLVLHHSRGRYELTVAGRARVRELLNQGTFRMLTD